MQIDPTNSAEIQWDVLHVISVQSFPGIWDQEKNVDYPDYGDF